MKLAHQSDIPHKLALYRLLDKLLSNPVLATNLYFKGGSCAAMLGYLDRFSVDLDFDLPDQSKKEIIKPLLNQVFQDLNYQIKDKSRYHLQYFLKYRDVEKQRNTLKLEITDVVAKANRYQTVHLKGIDRHCQAQTIETMFANKLVALKARWEKTGSVAGRDVYDIHYFFQQGYGVEWGVIEELRGSAAPDYLKELIEFVQKEVKQQYLFEDLNPLLPTTDLRQVVPELKKEVLLALNTLWEM